jgi:outer membrane receptor protein involved in Fe transport
LIEFIERGCAMGSSRSTLPAVLAFLFTAGLTAPASAQEPAVDATITGRVLEQGTGDPVAGATVTVEGTDLRAVSDTAGVYRLRNVPAGRQVVQVQRLGYAQARFPVTVPARGVVELDLLLAIRALELEGVTVTADPVGRARGEFGTATVIGSDAIRAHTAASLAGMLELVPGTVLQPPGLSGVQQVSLRSVPTTLGGPANLAMASPADLAAFGTLIVLDGVPMSNNANLQTLGPRGELAFPTAAGGGIDLRRIPATTIERVEVIRGVPSARFGDLTQGVIVVETRAGEVEPELLVRYDSRSGEVTLLGGTGFADGHTGTVTFDVARTRMDRIRADEAYRLAGQLAHRAVLGGPVEGDRDRLVLDSRLDFFRMVDERPEEPDLQPGRASSTRDMGLRASTRARVALSSESRMELTTAVEGGRQRTFRQGLRIRAAMPFTDRLTEGRSTGHFVGGQYLSELWVDGEPWQVFSRIEGSTTAQGLGARHDLRAGVEARREWNRAAGFRFDVEFPPQVGFNGVNGFDRPRRFDDIPALSTSALYLDDRMTFALPAEMLIQLQAGVRVDVLHDGSTWFSGSRDAVVQPRFQAEFAPRPWLRFRGGVGRTAKLPSLQQLFPAPQYFDLVNVNWFANDPDERLAVLTTFILDPTNANLGYSRADKAEVGVEVGLGREGGLSLVAFQDRISGGVGLRREPHALQRELFQLADSTLGTGTPPEIVEPADQVDTVPVLLDRPANNLDMRSQGLELTAFLPEIRPLRTRVEMQGAWIRSRIDRDGYEFSRRFSDFQMDPDWPRVPYWEGAISAGDRGIFTTRIIHHLPAVGLVVTGTVQHAVLERRQDLNPADSLAFEGYLTRDGTLVPVPPERRGDPEFADLRERRVHLVTARQDIPSDWLLSLQVNKTLPADGRLSFFAFNALDRRGRFGQPGVPPRTHPPMQFGLEVTIPGRSLVPWL